MKVRRPFSSCQLAALIISAICGCSFPASAFEPKPEAATLQVGDQALKPFAVTTARTTHLVGTNRFSVAGNVVQRPSAGGRALAWTARSDDGSSLSWLGATTNIAFLLGYKTSEYGRSEPSENPPRIRRLDLIAGKWLSDLPLPPSSDDLEVKMVLGFLAGTENRVAILTGLGKRQPTKTGKVEITTFNLCLFKDSETKPLWTRQVASQGERPYTGGYLWGIPGPRYAGSDIQPLTWMRDRLLVCPEAMQSIYCLNPDTGSEIWQVERLWEFQRGFIGPSVWSHYIARFGIEDYELEKTNVTELRKAFDQRFQCALAGGPVSVPLNFPRDHGYESVFVATVKGPAGNWAGYLSDCVVYELGYDGELVSMGTLPQMVVGSQFCTQDGDVIWKCQHETFVRLSPSREAPSPSMGGGNPDGLFNLVWTRRVRYQPPQAWLSSGKAGDSSAFGESWAYCIPEGGYVLRKNDGLYSFPIAAVDLSTSQDTIMVLKVPFEGQIVLPESNISTESRSNGEEFHRAFNPLLLGVTGLQANGNVLEITIATESESNKWTLSFDVGKALSAATKTPPTKTNNFTASEPAPRTLRTQRDKDEMLEDLANGGDTNTVMVLLKVGANPKHASELGWTPLMVAAAYGNADMVDTLIAAGSDLNAADKNCGGQTVLMWAARSGRDAKAKVRSLLKAGADPNGTTKDGWNVLMSAAENGNLEVAEYLLQAGMKVSTRDHEGGTVLMTAARSGKTNVVSVVLKAGAEIDATDAKGMTALMQAAESFSTADVVELLLKAGADPNLKDKKGRTALAIAQKSNTFGADEMVTLLKPVTASSPDLPKRQ